LLDVFNICFFLVEQADQDLVVDVGHDGEHDQDLWEEVVEEVRELVAFDPPQPDVGSCLINQARRLQLLVL